MLDCVCTHFFWFHPWPLLSKISLPKGTFALHTLFSHIIMLFFFSSFKLPHPYISKHQEFNFFFSSTFSVGFFSHTYTHTFFFRLSFCLIAPQNENVGICFTPVPPSMCREYIYIYFMFSTLTPKKPCFALTSSRSNKKKQRAKTIRTLCLIFFPPAHLKNQRHSLLCGLGKKKIYTTWPPFLAFEDYKVETTTSIFSLIHQQSKKDSSLTKISSIICSFFLFFPSLRMGFNQRSEYPYSLIHTHTHILLSSFFYFLNFFFLSFPFHG